MSILHVKNKHIATKTVSLSYIICHCKKYEVVLFRSREQALPVCGDGASKSWTVRKIQTVYGKSRFLTSGKINIIQRLKQLKERKQLKNSLQTGSQAVIQSVAEVSQAVSERNLSDCRSVSRYISQSAYKSTNQSPYQSVCRSIRQSFRRSFSESVNLSGSKPVIQPFCKSVCQPIT